MKTILKLVLSLLFTISANAQTETKLPFVGIRYFNYSGGGSCCFAQITIYKNGNCIIKGKSFDEREFGKNARIMYSGIYKSTVWTYEKGKRDSGFKIEKNHIMFLDKNGQPEVGCDEDKKPCKFALSAQLYTI